ncbi:MAG TPA: glycosyltransferase [Solirubrobacteraceae bacterium]
MNADPDISVLVPVLNEAAHIRETVAAMQTQELGDLTMELLFVDGTSDDGTKAILDQLAKDDPRIRVFDNPARTTAIALNIARRNARGHYLARMDAHSFFPPRYLATGVERLQRGDGVEQVAGPMLPRGTGRWSRRVTLALGTRLGMGGSRRWEAAATSDGGQPIEIELDTGVFAGVWKAETVNRLGGWDDGFPVNQDSELAARILAKNGRIVCLSSMGSAYLPRNDLRALWRQYSRYGYYRAKTSSRHPSSLRTSNLLPPMLVITTIAAVITPRPLRRMAQIGVGLYASAVGVESLRARRHAPLRVARGLPAVFVTLHASWGIGFLLGLIRFGGVPAILREQLTRVHKRLI